MFVGRFGKGWSGEEIRMAHDALLRAAAWIEREAIRHGAALNIDLADTDFVADDWGPDEGVEVAFVPGMGGDVPFESHAADKALRAFSRAASHMGFAGAAELIAETCGRVEADARVWVLHPRSAGLSFALAEVDTRWPGASLAVCYAREASFPEPLERPPFPDPVTYAHELLHLFGASDKYGVPLSTFPPGSVSSRDVMRLGHERLSQLRIDRRTAEEIGWAPRDDRAAG
jgi:hypothetical protein